jgi:hypothetical protein
MKSKHTPGPWKASITAERLGEKRTFIYSETKEKQDRSEYRPAPLVTILEVCVDKDEHEANAALIAAAPELLAAVEIGLNAIENEYPAGEMEKLKGILRAAIAKATGKGAV